MEREEEHVGALREKDDHYGTLVGQLKRRIEDLESKLESVAARRTSVVEGELASLKAKLVTAQQQQAAVAVTSPTNPTADLTSPSNNQQHATAAVQTSAEDLSTRAPASVTNRKLRNQPIDALPYKDAAGFIYDPLNMMRPPMSRGARHAGLVSLIDIFYKYQICPSRLHVPFHSALHRRTSTSASSTAASSSTTMRAMNAM